MLTIASMNAEIANWTPIIRDRILDPFLPLRAMSRSASIGFVFVISQAGYSPANKPTNIVVPISHGMVTA